MSDSQRADMIARRTLAIFREKVLHLQRMTDDVAANEGVDGYDTERVLGESDGYACVLAMLDIALERPKPAPLDNRVTDDGTRDGTPVQSRTVCNGAFTIARTPGNDKTVTLTREISGTEVCCASQSLATRVASTLGKIPAKEMEVTS